MPRRVNGQGEHYYSVLWAWQSKYDRAVVRGNTYKAAVAAQDMNGAAATFTNSVESCNTPAFNLRGMTKETCSGTDARPTPQPTPEPEPTPTPTTPTPRLRPRRATRPRRRSRRGWRGARSRARAIGLRWNASTDNVGVTGYRIYRNGSVVGTTTGTSYTVGGLSCDTSYTIGLTAIDAKGNESNRAEATGTTKTSACPATGARPDADADPDADPVALARCPPRRPTALVGAWGFNETSGSTPPTPAARATRARSTAPPARRPAGSAAPSRSTAWTTSSPSRTPGSLDLSKGMTLEAWVNPTVATGGRSVIFKENLPAKRPSYALYASNGNTKPTAEITAGSSLLNVAGSELIPANTWSHIAATYDGATLRVFRNGVLIGSRAVTGAMPNSSNPLKFGGNSVWSEWFKGTIDEVRCLRRRAHRGGDPGRLQGARLIGPPVRASRTRGARTSRPSAVPDAAPWRRPARFAGRAQRLRAQRDERRAHLAGERVRARLRLHRDRRRGRVGGHGGRQGRLVLDQRDQPGARRAARPEAADGRRPPRRDGGGAASRPAAARTGGRA